MTSVRDHVRAAFLAGAGWGGVPLKPMPGDASSRAYFRLADHRRRAVLMDAPPPERVAAFIRIAALLRGLGYSAPAILAADEPAGFLLLEDLGDRTYTRVIRSGGDETALYQLAADLLADLHDRFDPASDHGVPVFSEAMMLENVGRFLDWFMPAATGAAVPPAVAAEYQAIWRRILPLAHALPSTLILRDYHIDNLMLLDRPGLSACGLLDFQDALIAPCAYDLVSLIEDARRDVGAELHAAIRARYLARRPAIDPTAFALAIAVLGAQRNIRIMGNFTRLCRRDGKPGYLKHLPRLWRLVERSIEHPALAELRQWLADTVPPELRGIPPSLAAQARG
jgi:aminoglycoside/choline kinase family phosphotransferase